MTKIRIAFGYLAFPFTMANYFLRALFRRDDVEVVTFGPYFGQWIPWNGGMEIPMKYSNNVDIPLSRGVNTVSWETINGLLPWEPDLILNVDAGFHLSNNPNIIYAVVGTDPHVLGDWYNQVRPHADFFFNMQPSYMQKDDILLPYAFDPTVHYPKDGSRFGGFGTSVDNPPVLYYDSGKTEKEYDCSIIGLHYPQRDEWIKRLREKGIKVNYRIGDIYDEYREENNKAWIGLNWSSLQDVTARVFEIMAMGMVPVINRLPALAELGFIENFHYIGFSDTNEAVEKVLWAKSNPDKANEIAKQAYEFVHEKNMTWDNRVEQILKEVGLK